VNAGKMQNVLVRVTKGHEGIAPTPVPTEEVILDQKGCIYTPRVVGARVGQKVTFINSDPIFHNVRSVTNLNQRFNVAMPKKDQRETRVFNKPEIFLQAKCSVHPWMTGYVAVMDHSFFSVTNAKGEFQIKDLPPGNYTLEAWHEVFGTLTQEITITETGISEIKFNYKK
jgi:plastocyanin